MNINEHLAVNVMGFIPTDLNGLVFYSGIDCLIDNWKPLENIEQAFMCLEKFTDWEITRSSAVEDTYDEYEIYIPTEKRGKRYTSAEFITKAISLACAKATGWKE